MLEYINHLNLEDYIGPYNPKDVVVLADSGYDDNRIQRAIAEKNWNFIIALNKNRGVKSGKKYVNTPKSSGWSQVARVFGECRIKWQTIRIPTNSSKKKRTEFRIRQMVGHLRQVCRVQLICSEFKKRPDGRIKYLACNDLEATARDIIMGYRIRWRIEIFHKEVKMLLGFEDVATTRFASVISHVHWVYCAYILLQSCPVDVGQKMNSIVAKKQYLKEVIHKKDTARVLQLLTQIGGLERYKTELRRALAGVDARKPLLNAA